MDSLFKINNIKTRISFFLFIAVNFLFTIKYIERITPYYLIVAIIYSLFCISIWKYRKTLTSFLSKFRFINSILIVLFILVFTLLFIKIPQETLNVDRWSVISSFWNNYFSDKYVYLATSHMGNYPGPMPFYYILALPFYLLGELGYFSLFGLIIFLILLRYDKVASSKQTVFIILLFISTFNFWEIISRSNIFLNASLVLFSMIYLFKNIEKRTPYFVLWSGILIGLMLSTRNVFVIPYIVTFLYLLKFKEISVTQVFQLGIIAVFTFILTFLPFTYNYFEEFKTINPFIIQSDYLMPQYLTYLCVVSTFMFVFLVKSKEDVYFYSGIALFLTILVYYMYHVLNSGFYEAFFESRIDLSYFILSMPFLLFYLFKKTDDSQFMHCNLSES